MIYINNGVNFNDLVPLGEDLKTTFRERPLILRKVYAYDGPVTLQYLPYGGIQSVFGNHIIINTANGFIATDNVNYDGIEYSSAEFIAKFPDLVNEVLSS